MDISAAPGGAAEPQGQVVQGGGQLPSDWGVGQGWAAAKPGQAPACWLPHMLVVAAEELVDMDRAEYQGHPQQFLWYHNPINARISDHFCVVLTTTPFKLGG